MADSILERVVELSVRLSHLRHNVAVLNEQHGAVHVRLTTARAEVEATENELREILNRPLILPEPEGGPGSRPGSLLFRVRELLERTREALGPKEIAAALDADANQVYAALSRLHAESKIAKVGPGTYRGLTFFHKVQVINGGTTR